MKLKSANLAIVGSVILIITSIFNPAILGDKDIRSQTVIAKIAEGSNLTITAVNSSTFLSRWDTTLTSPGSSTSQQVKLPLESNGTYDFTVDWGDGVNETISSWNQTEVTHTYASEGVYFIAIEGTFVGWRFNDGGDKLKIIEISQWGNIRLGNSTSYFFGSSNLLLTATDALNLTGTTNLSYAFMGCTNLGNSGNMNNWDVSSVTSMERMFFKASSFNQPIGDWNVSSVRGMSVMFYSASSFSQPIGDWNVSSVRDMSGMFQGASSFNQPIGNWDVSSVTNMQFLFAMFQGAFPFNQPIGDWDVSSVTNMQSMFGGASSFNQPLGDWDVSSVTSMRGMFERASSFNQPLGDWDVSSVTSMVWMFGGPSSFNQPLGDWDVSSVTNMDYMFLGVTLSTTNYDNLLAGWSVLSLQYGVTFHGGNSLYTNTAARQHIIDTFGWTIIDLGLATASSQTTSSKTTEISTSKSDTSDNNFLQFSVFLLSIVSIAIIQILRKNRSNF